MLAPWSSSEVQARIVSDGQHRAAHEDEAQRRSRPPFRGRARRRGQGRTGGGAALQPRGCGSRRRTARDPVDRARGAGGQPRVSPSSVPIRYGRMLASPFTFYRGAAADHGRRPRRDPDVRARACSSAATRTCRTSASSRSPERRLVFDINDFDETLPGPWEWDVKRLAASIEIAGRDRGFTRSRARADRRWPRSRAYREAMRRVRRRCATSTSGTRGSTSTAIARRAGRPGRASAGASAFERDAGQGAHARTACRRSRKLTHDGRRRAADRQRPAADRRRSTSCCRRAPSATSSRSELHELLRALPPHAAAPTGATCSSSYRLRRRGAQGRRRGQRRHPRLDRAAARAATTTTPSSSRSRRPGIGARAATSGASRYAHHGERVVDGPAADAGGERHLPRLGTGSPGIDGERATSTSASCGTGRARPRSS